MIQEKKKNICNDTNFKWIFVQEIDDEIPPYNVFKVYQDKPKSTCLRSMNHENSAGFGADWVQTSHKLERAVAFAYFLLRPSGTVKLPPTKFKRTDVRKESSPGYPWSGSCPGLSISRSVLPSRVTLVVV
jgi:hypothetical protein